MVDRESASRRGYGRKWQRAREQYLKENPLCVEHKKRGRVVPATIVDHIVPHRMDMKLFWRRSNWQALCKQCHDSHKQRLEKSGTAVGCTEDGLPLDSAHHWHET